MSDDDNDNLPLAWKKAQVVASIISSFVIPGVVFIVGTAINASIQSSELSLKYINIATEILKLDKKEDSEALRSWAVHIINKYSQDVPMSAKAQEQAKKVGITPPTRISGDWGSTDFSIFSCEDTPDAKNLATAVILKIAEEKHGEIVDKGVFTDKKGSLTIQKLRGKFTIIVDGKHDERIELPRITKILEKVPKALPIQTVDNNDTPTPWRISIVVCPK